VIYAD
jgi:hypothetical protein